MDDFDVVQTGLPTALAANVPGSGVDHVVIAMASYSVGESLLAHYGARIPAMEHRYLNALLLLNRIDCDVVVLCSRAPPSEVVSAYLDLVPPDVADRMRTRARVVCVDDETARPLAEKVLARPDIVAEVRDLVGGRVAVLEPWNVTDHEVALAVALGVPVNGTAPALRSEAFKGAGRRLFAGAGVPMPLGREGVRTATDVVSAIEWIRDRRPDLGAVVVKHDDSGAGDGNVVLAVREPGGSPMVPQALRAAVARLPAWYTEDLANGGGVVEELVVGEDVRTPSVQVDLMPDGGVRVLSTHEQIIGGDNGQVYVGCRFPADPVYAREIADHGRAIGRALAARGCAGRASVDFIASRSCSGDWAVKALEVNLRKGGTTHPFSALRNLVPGRYDAATGEWVADADGSRRAYRSTDNVVDPAWVGRRPSSVIEAVRAAGLEFDSGCGTGVVLHMLTCLAVDGRFGATAIARTPAQADDLFDALRTAVSC